MKNKVLMCIMCITLLTFSSFCVYAKTSTTTSTPTLVTKINSAFTRIKGYLQKIASPVAAVCIASGIFIRKLSFGDERKMQLGKKIIINGIIGYASIQMLDLILKFIEAVIK